MLFSLMARPKGGVSRRRNAAACPLPPPSRTLESVVPGDALLADLSEGYTQSRCQPPAAPGNCGRPAPPSQTRSRGSCQGLFYPQILPGNQLFDDRLTASEEEQLEALLAADTDRQRRQVSITVSARSTNRLPLPLWVPKQSFRQMTACRSARSAVLFVGWIWS